MDDIKDIVDDIKDIVMKKKKHKSLESLDGQKNNFTFYVSHGAISKNFI